MKILTLEDHRRLCTLEQLQRLRMRKLRLEAAKQGLVDKKEGNAEYQRNKLLTKEQIARRAIERMTQNMMTYTRATQGDAAVSEEAARRKVIEMQHKLDVDKSR